MVNVSKFRFPNLPRLNPGARLGFLPSADHAYHREEGVSQLRVIPLVLVSERSNKIVVPPIYALSVSARPL